MSVNAVRVYVYMIIESSDRRLIQATVNVNVG